MWSQSVMFEPRQARKTRSVDALKKSNDSPYVICTVARLFWAEGRVEKARDWFKRAVATNGDIGDCWGWWYRFEKEHGTKVNALARLSGPSFILFSHRNISKL